MGGGVLIYRTTSAIPYHISPITITITMAGTAGAAFTQNAVDPPPDWNELCFYKWGYARVTAVNSTYLSWDWVESSTGQVWDRMAIQV